MQQLALQIQPPIPPTLDNFVCGRNAEALAALRTLASHPHAEGLIYVWGPTGCGKSHLLLGLQTALRSNAHVNLQWIDALHEATQVKPEASSVIVDNVHRASPVLAESIFHAWNRIKEQGGQLVCAGDCPPAQLALAPELYSRLAWGQVYRLQSLDDQEKWDAMKLKATMSAIPITDEAISYLMMHTARDLPSLMHRLEQLDTLSLSSKRPITVPLVRAYLASANT